MTTAAAAQAHPDAAAATEAAAAATAAAAAASKTPEQIAAAEKATADAAAAAKTAADAAAAETARLDAEAKAKLKAPEKYALAVPKGSELYVGDAELKAVEAKARAKALSNDAAQGLVDEIAEERAAVSAALRAETEADPTWGGEKLPETQRLANLALDAIWPKGTPLGDRVRDVLVRTGMANDLAIVSGLASWGKQMAEDTPIVGGARRADPGAKGGASLLYDHPTSKAVDAAGSS